MAEVEERLDNLYVATIEDINIHNHSVKVVPKEPKFEWQRGGIWVDYPNYNDFKMGDIVEVEFKTFPSSAQYVINRKIGESLFPMAPTYEKVQRGKWYDHYLCCTKADRSPRFCVCSVLIECPVHGEQHIGTHD